MTEAREEGFYWVVLGQNPPEIAYWERGEANAAAGPEREQRLTRSESDKAFFLPLRASPREGAAPSV